MIGHDRYEALAGAVMLGEATAAERAEFEAHAATCAGCREDASAGRATVATLANVRDAETWRPTLPVMAAIRERSQRRFRWTLGAFGWAVGASLVLNVALVGGVGNGLITRLSQPAETQSAGVSSSITFDAPHVHFGEAAPARPAVEARLAPLGPKDVSKSAVARDTSARTGKRSVEPRPATVNGDVPDLLAGLDLDGSLDRRAVALERARCRPEAATSTVAKQSETVPADDAGHGCPTPHP